MKTLQDLGTSNFGAHRAAARSPGFATICMIRQAGGIARYHTEPMIPAQSVAEHSWHGAMMALKLWPLSPQIAIAFLKHDTGELGTGDIPAPAKWINPDYKKEAEVTERKTRELLGTVHDLHADDATRLHFIDSMELMWYCADCYHRGNTFAKTVFFKVQQRWVPLLSDTMITVLGQEAVGLFFALTDYVNGE